MKVLPPAILFLEAVVVALSIPVAVTTAGRGAGVAWVLGVLALLLLLTSGIARRPRGVAVGWVLQVAVLATGFLVPAMAVMGLVFLGVWVTALVYGGKADRIAAQHRTEAAAASASRASRADISTDAPASADISTDAPAGSDAPAGDASGPTASDG